MPGAKSNWTDRSCTLLALSILHLALTHVTEGSRCNRDAPSGEGDRRARRAGRREDREGSAGRPLPGADRDDAVGADARSRDARGLDAAVSRRADAAVDGEAAGEDHRAADLSRQLLPSQGGPREACLRTHHVALWRTR